MMSKVTRADILTNPRWAGEVERYHTWPINRRQSVGEHTWQVMRIYWEIWGPMSSAVSSVILWHDAGELGTGDIPFPVKRNNPILKEEFDQLEIQVLMAMGVDTRKCVEGLKEEELLRIEVCDLIEMWEFGAAELARGNQMALPIVRDITLTLGGTLDEMSDQDQQLVLRYTSKQRFPNARD